MTSLDLCEQINDEVARTQRAADLHEGKPACGYGYGDVEGLGGGRETDNYGASQSECEFEGHGTGDGTGVGAVYRMHLLVPAGYYPRLDRMRLTAAYSVPMTLTSYLQD